MTVHNGMERDAALPDVFVASVSFEPVAVMQA
ncbi:Uncharacterised protein [Bartonella grahamii]|uniref:Uncharacterized protein n=1 Tax=Bartonella grahamii TaxID=33045 RepID=A0A336NAI6_BARGR|nr:Uncharacterised protein [Bartonella grahamii]